MLSLLSSTGGNSRVIKTESMRRWGENQGPTKHLTVSKSNLIPIYEHSEHVSKQALQNRFVPLCISDVEVALI
jgi:hypothetical protein